MKTRYWVAILLAIVLLSLGTLFFTGDATDWIEVRCDGELLRRISLSKDGDYTITTDYGENVLSVRHGRVSVTASDCPGGDCTRMTLTPGGAIICLPHHLVISYAENSSIDGVTG